ncbi:hypothetical protein F1188_13985 [Roseospira marina]|uniref:Damage-inducible mutagenesis protein n=1 Tax=Roseospira marina TaxID=140057 RepID=A0A5M6I9J9_9PROT|nr:hypothetical protein [Roseospira marina]KAA5604921.1 hypothetical protein F1188_13985 [Roseospira marina]MBB4315265.1 protein ImuA [Roseospira marina]MBB5088265.1 protein ImuA [Roseospira marina]
MSHSSSLERLRQRIQRLEGASRTAGATLPLGLEAVDTALPWGGLPLGCLHQVVGADADPAEQATGPAAALGFTALLAGRLAAHRDAPVLWCLRQGGTDDTLYPPGLAQLGLPPRRIMIARARDDAQVLWCLEEGLRTPGLAAVVGQVRVAGLTAGRRLQLAAEAGGVTGLLLVPAGRAGPAGSVAATTRWRVTPVPAAPVAWSGLGAVRWDVRLERCRSGRPAGWRLEWNDETSALSVVAALRDGSGDPCGNAVRWSA